MPKQVRFSLNRKLAATTPDGSPEVKYGVLEGDSVYEVPGREAAHALSDVRLLPPCWPTKVVCVGRNYRDHAAELGNEVPSEPLIFLKPPSSLLANGDPILYPSISERVDHEAELGVVIGRRARNVKRSDAEAYILGYTCVNDVTARDLQFKDGQWTRAKGFDTFCPVGPWVLTRDEVAFDKIVVRAFVDGEKKQEASVRDMVFPVGELIEFITRVMTLEPGDLIATGTPSGISAMQPGAVVRVVVEGVGALENRVMKP
ncbi:MAG TPA: fumarylacetoacetate hydrolase family protein [Bryobacteraceae bacterium]|nr:fumarylacetoacetate hydrolase family protein [Bryobacteraceae bacterium]